MPRATTPALRPARLEPLEARLLLSATFADSTATLGLPTVLPSQYLHAGAIGDVNGDGYQDLFYGSFGTTPATNPPNDGTNRLYIYDPDTGLYEESVQADINLDNGRTSGSVFADMDNDGDLDLLVMNNYRANPVPQTNPPTRRDGRNQLLRNDGNGNFADVTAGSHIADWTMSARNPFVLDYDGDGWLDVLMQDDWWGSGSGSRLMRNNHDMTFTDATTASGLPTTLRGIGGAVGDLNGDTYPDILFAGSTAGSVPNNRMFLNDGDGTFTEITSLTPINVTDASAPWGDTGWPLNIPGHGGEDWVAGADFGDLDGDGDIDIVMGNHFVSGFSGAAQISVRVYMNTGNDAQGRPQFTDITVSSDVLATALYSKMPHVAIRDFDNDGLADIWVGNTMELTGTSTPAPYILYNTGNSGGVPHFVPPPGIDPATTRDPFDIYGLPTNPRYLVGAPTADFNLDGKLDIFMVEAFNGFHYPAVFLNTTSSLPNYIDVQIRTQDPSGNVFGIGATVQVYQPGHADQPAYLLGTALMEVGNGYVSGGVAILHFGTPGYDTVDVVARMPNGGPVYTASDVDVNELVTLPMINPDNEPPTAVIIADVTSGMFPLTVNFDASGSSDTDGTILTYAWNFGDGSTGSGVTVSHEYVAQGNYTVVLTVTDDGWARDTDSVDIHVTADNVQPTASFQANPAAGVVPLTVSFNASASRDLDGTIVTYAWNFGDGNTGSGVTTSHQYTATGGYTAVLTVTDNRGDSSSTSRMITVSSATNAAPVAVIRVNTTTGEVPFTVIFDGTSSSDSDGTIASYQWNFGDGATASSILVSHQYAVAGNYVATLTVVDDRDAVGTATTPIVALPGNDFGPDTQPPYVISVQVNRQGADRSMISGVTLGFNEDVFGSLDIADMALRDGTGSTLGISACPLTRQAGTLTTRLDLSGLNLPEGAYELSILSAGVSDAAGNFLDGNGDGTAGDNYVHPFYRLAGDVNDDGKVTVNDLGILGAGYGDSGNWWDLPADMNSDGTVGQADLDILLANLHRNLLGGAPQPALAAGPQAALAAATAPPPSASVQSAPATQAAGAAGVESLAAPPAPALALPGLTAPPTGQPGATVIGAETAQDGQADGSQIDLLKLPQLAALPLP